MRPGLPVVTAEGDSGFESLFCGSAVVNVLQFRSFFVSGRLEKD